MADDLEDWDKVAQEFGTDKASKIGYGHGYMEHYEKLLGGRDLRNILEIGVYLGGSLRMWKKLFPEAKVFGIDNNEYCASLCKREGIQIDIVDAGDMVQLTEYSANIPMMDLIIDDGSHEENDVEVAQVILWDKLVIGGLYVIEDVWIPQRIDYLKWTGLLGRLRDWAGKMRAGLEIYPDRLAAEWFTNSAVARREAGYSLMVLRKTEC